MSGAAADLLTRANVTFYTTLSEKKALVGDNASWHENQAAWERLIRETLIEWSRDPSQFDDEEIEPPSEDLISLALELAWDWRRSCLEPPSRIVPNGDGGISFMRSDGPLFQELEVFEDGSMEIRTFEDCRLVKREVLNPSP